MPITINKIDIIFFVLILSFKKKYPIKIEKNILVSRKAETNATGALVNPHTIIM